MANPHSENLYLLEFLVNDIDLGKKCDCGGGNELCVYFQFLDNQELQLCQRDFDEDPTQKIDTENHRVGKSCIFSLTPKQAETALQQFDVNVYVQKKPPPNRPVDDTIVGATIISIADLLADLLVCCPKPPSAKVLEETYELMKHNKKAGSIDVFLRLSCYGKMIITQFQMNMADKTVLFKDKEGRSLYRYRKRKTVKPQKIEDMSASEPPQSCPDVPCFPDGRPDNFSGKPPCATPRGPPPGCPNVPCFPDGRPANFMGSPPCAMPPMGGPPNMFGGGGMFPDQGGFPPQFGGGPAGCPESCPPEELNMFYPPTLTQQASVFPTIAYDRQMGGSSMAPRSQSNGGGGGGCAGGCGRR